jgi:hypothetical protein
MIIQRNKRIKKCYNKPSYQKFNELSENELNHWRYDEIKF